MNLKISQNILRHSQRLSTAILFCACSFLGISAFGQASAGRPEPTPPPTPTPAPPSPIPVAPSSFFNPNNAPKKTTSNAKPLKNANPIGIGIPVGVDPDTEPALNEPATYEVSKKFPKQVNKLIVDDIIRGRGKQSKLGDKLKINYTAWIYDSTQPLGRGPKIETTIGKTPYLFKIGDKDHAHIRGWEEGLLEFKPGGRRRLIIPPDYAYGSNGAGEIIPPGTTLLYEVELIEID